VRISLQDARRLAIWAQHLAGPRPAPTRAGILRLVRDIGYLQLDPTNVVARNPYLIVWSRVGSFDPALLDDLHAAHRQLFETPSFLLPVSDLPIHAATMGNFRSGTTPGGPSSVDTWRSRAKDWLTRHQRLRREVVARLRRDGPLALTAFEGRTHVTWTSGDLEAERNVGLLLAILQRRGEVVVAGRRRGQKLWGLADGWLPKTTPLAPAARAREATLRSLRANGLATLKQLRRYYAFNRHISARSVARLERDGDVVRVEVEGLREPFYTTTDLARRLRAVRERWDGRTTLLSPFDNLIHDRDRLEMLFGYRYRIEIYTPVRLRKLGFWAMPVLHGDRIIGSVDPKLDRERRVLVVNRIVTEKGAPVRAIRGAVNELADFVSATKVEWPTR
jgi:uncharacterized protein